jgi:hypothetical protein
MVASKGLGVPIIPKGRFGIFWFLAAILAVSDTGPSGLIIGDGTCI